MKRAIYLDGRERDLARRICDWVCFKAEEELGHTNERHVTSPAIRWFRDEIQALRVKFEEPEISPEPDEARKP